jgi:Protein of unknown function (DUF2380)
MDNHPPAFKQRYRPACGRGRMKSRQCGLVLILLLAGFGGAARAEPVRAAVFGFELDDTSLSSEMHGVRPDEQARMQHLDAQLRAVLTKAGYELADLAPVAAERREADLRTCGGCDVALAKKLGAEISVTGWVQKVSELILNINVVMRDVPSGKVVRAGSVDIRGNTDESWTRGLSYLVAERLLPKGEALPR